MGGHSKKAEMNKPREQTSFYAFEGGGMFWFCVYKDLFFFDTPEESFGGKVYAFIANAWHGMASPLGTIKREDE